jgi:hypothetical protein
MCTYINSVELFSDTLTYQIYALKTHIYTYTLDENKRKKEREREK